MGPALVQCSQLGETCKTGNASGSGPPCHCCSQSYTSAKSPTTESFPIHVMKVYRWNKGTAPLILQPQQRKSPQPNKQEAG